MYAPTNLGQLGYTAEDAAWLRNEYVSILGYPADEAGFNYWAKRIDEVGREPVHQSFLNIAASTRNAPTIEPSFFQKHSTLVTTIVVGVVVYATFEGIRSPGRTWGRSDRGLFA